MYQQAQADFGFYLELTHHHQYIPAPHLDLICEALHEVEAGRIRRLAVLMPPQHGKSTTLTKSFPSWMIGRHPDLKVIEVSYGETLAQEFGRANRQKVDEFGPQIFGVRVTPDNSSVTKWGIERKVAGRWIPAAGGMLSAGILSGVTGHGAGLLLLDDPIKNRAEAQSITYRDRIWSEWQNSFLTRLSPDGVACIIFTHWHEDDIWGRIEKSEVAEDWTLIKLPATAEENDPLGRSPGEALWPTHGYTAEWLSQQKRAVGTFTYTALYQQRPAPMEGEVLKRKWWKFWRALPSELDLMIQSWDCSIKDLKESDYVAGHIWGFNGADNYLIDRVHGKMDLPTTIEAVRTFSAKWPQARRKLIEDKANGTAVIQILRKRIPGLIAVEPEGGKVVRAIAAQPLLEAGNTYLPDPTIAPWVHDVITECSAFPNGAHDDDVDAMTQALNWHENHRPAVVRVGGR